MKILLLCLISSLMTYSARGGSSNDPLYELGLAGGGGMLPDYPGSDRSRARALILPYFVYRGSIFRSDDKEGTRARLVRNETFDLDFSAAGSFPASSGDNPAREGMPDLDWMAEVGPRLEFRIFNFENGGHFRFQFPLRAVVSTNFSNLVYRGYTYLPGLALNLHETPFADWKTYLKIQWAFTDEKLARYFFEVEPLYARANRPSYGAKGGFLETEIMLGFGFQLDSRLKCYSGLWATALSGSVNEDSPLVKSRVNYSGIVGLTYLFYESEARGEL